MKIKMNNGDWESLVIVSDSFKADKMTLGDVVVLQKIQNHIRQSLANFLVQKSQIVIKGQALVDSSQKELLKLQEKYPKDPNNKEIIDFVKKSNDRLDNEINGALKDIEGENVEIEMPDDWYDRLRRLFAQQAFFGVNGYNDNPFGHAAFTRTVEALGISLDELGKSNN